MKVLRESYTLNEIQDRITDTRNIFSALRDSLYVLSSALENPDEQREEYEDLAYNVDKYYIGDIESIIGDFERDSKHIEELEESVKRKRNKRVNEGMLRTVDFGTINIVPRSKITKFDKFIKNDLADEYCYYQTADGEVVAVENESSLEEDINAIRREAFELLDDLGGYTDYTGRIEAVADEFNLSFDESEGLVDEWIHNVDDEEIEESLKEDTVKTKDGKWTNKGDTGETHGEFKTKKEADAQRKAMFANGYRENLKEWDTMEPSAFASNGHSYYDNPPDWKTRLQKVKDLIYSQTDRLVISGSSPWGCIIKGLDKNGDDLGVVQKIDFWASEEDFNDQLDNLNDIIYTLNKYS